MGKRDVEDQDLGSSPSQKLGKHSRTDPRVEQTVTYGIPPETGLWPYGSRTLHYAGYKIVIENDLSRIAFFPEDSMPADTVNQVIIVIQAILGLINAVFLKKTASAIGSGIPKSD